MMLSFKLTLFLVTSTLNVYAQEPSEKTVLSNQVQQLLKVNSEMLNTSKVEQLTKKILDNRQHYSNDILSKTSLLSARIATNQGDINKVFHFAQQGLVANGPDKNIKLSLVLKLAEVFVAQHQYKQLLALVYDAINNREFSNNAKNHLLALSYRSLAYAMLGKHAEALSDLQQVEIGISQSELTEHIELLTVLARAYHNLNDYQTSLTMQLKILKLRFAMKQMQNIDQAYLYLGYAYFYLQRFDDAYNAFWESKEYALNKKAPIAVAHAEKALGLVLLKQQQFFEALAPLEQAVKIYSQHNMTTDRIESSVGLAKAKIESQQVSEGYSLVIDVIRLLNGEDISLKFAGFYGMVSEMYFAQQNYKKAYDWREKYSRV